MKDFINFLFTKKVSLIEMIVYVFFYPGINKLSEWIVEKIFSLFRKERK